MLLISSKEWVVGTWRILLLATVVTSTCCQHGILECGSKRAFPTKQLLRCKDRVGNKGAYLLNAYHKPKSGTWHIWENHILLTSTQYLRSSLVLKMCVVNYCLSKSLQTKGMHVVVQGSQSPRWVDRWKNMNNLAVLHAIVTGLALIDMHLKMSSVCLKFGVTDTRESSEQKKLYIVGGLSLIQEFLMSNHLNMGVL